jgi:hypothetical protein
LISYPISFKSVGQPARQLATTGICFVEGKVSKKEGKKRCERIEVREGRHGIYEKEKGSEMWNERKDKT